MEKSALILGSTGLVGNFCLNILLENPQYSKITIIVRKPIAINHIKLNQIICSEFSNLDEYAIEFNVDEVFCCIGTTIKIAGSKEAFTAVDFAIPVLAAQLSTKQSVGLFSVISAAGSNKYSRNFYLHIKGFMEQEVRKCDLIKIHIFRPGLILGDRMERRSGERIAQFLMPIIDKILWGKFKKQRFYN